MANQFQDDEELQAQLSGADIVKTVIQKLRQLPLKTAETYLAQLVNQESMRQLHQTLSSIVIVGEDEDDEKKKHAMLREQRAEDREWYEQKNQEKVDKKVCVKFI